MQSARSTGYAVVTVVYRAPVALQSSALRDMFIIWIDIHFIPARSELTPLPVFRIGSFAYYVIIGPHDLQMSFPYTAYQAFSLLRTSCYDLHPVFGHYYH